ncbi:MAG: hypothetical protein V9E82_10730 [Candidatus Nanopelagicales bacterium]
MKGMLPGVRAARNVLTIVRGDILYFMTSKVYCDAMLRAISLEMGSRNRRS